MGISVGLCKTGLSSRECLAVSLSVTLKLMVLFTKNGPRQHLVPDHQADKYSLKIFIYNWRKIILCLSGLRGVFEAPQCNSHLFPKETGQFIQMITGRNTLAPLLLRILRVRKDRILHGIPQVLIPSV